MKIRATDDEIDISDDLLGMNVTGRMISDFLCRDEETEITLESNTDINPEPYERVLNSLTIHKNDGPTLIEEVQGTLVVSVSPENLERFLSFFEFDKESKVGDHSHFDYLDGDIYVHKDSRSLVVTLE
ncbi:MAG: hypothetical protein OQK51_25010 [Kangiellaceae bacterium]|nr:hypothetical protein [Kangiellaceae bacterium]